MFISSGTIAVIIFLITLFLMVKPPKGTNIGLIAGIGGVLSLVFGTVSLLDATAAVKDILNAAFAFLGIVTLSITLDKMGFFKWAALRMAKLAGGNGYKLYFYLAFLSAGVSILFANDSAVLILTPIVLEIIKALKIEGKNRLAYLFSAGLIADTAAMPFITSNPVNIVSADYFGYNFIQHFVLMGLVAFSTILLSMLVVFLFFRKQIPATYSIEIVDILISSEVITKRELQVSFSILILVDISYVILALFFLPVSIAVCSGAVFLLGFYSYERKNSYALKQEKETTWTIIKEINWSILVFMVGIFMVVLGLRSAGVNDFYANLFYETTLLPPYLNILIPSLIVTISASLMNNWPMTLLGLLSIQQSSDVHNFTPQQKTGLIFSNIIGNNIGPHFFPIGSLAIIMWMSVMKKKGVTITLVEYLKIGAFLSIIEVIIASFVLWIEIYTFNFIIH